MEETWKIIFYEDQRRERPVELFILKQRLNTQVKIAHIVKLLRIYGFHLGMPQSKKLSTKLYELRIRGTDEIRIFYTLLGNQIHLLHAFKKQTQKTPKRELETALKRIKSIDIK